MDERMGRLDHAAAGWVLADLERARREKRKRLAVLFDPDQPRLGQVERMLDAALAARVDYIFVGGSLIVHDAREAIMRAIRLRSATPVVLFPGHPVQLSADADAVLLLSLISGRNPDLLIGQHVVAAPFLRQSGLEVIPTGYMLVDGGVATAAQYMSNTMPIPAAQTELAACTAMAGEMLGLRTLYLDAGSGALRPPSEAMVNAVRQAVQIPLMVGGGIRDVAAAASLARAGADLIVVGSAFEERPEVACELAEALRQWH